MSAYVKYRARNVSFALQELTPKAGAAEQDEEPGVAESLPGASSDTQQASATGQLHEKEEEKGDTEKGEEAPKAKAEEGRRRRKRREETKTRMQQERRRVRNQK